MDNLTQIEVLVLAAVADEPRYGYDLAQRVAELTGDRQTIRPGNLYRVLHRLLERGLVRELEGSADEDERRRYFQATARGRRAAASELALYSSVLRRVPTLREALSDG